MTLMYVIVLLLLAVGLTGALVQIWPSTPFILVGLFYWAYMLGGRVAWTFFGVATVLLLSAMVLKFIIPGKQLKNAGIPTTTLLWGGLAGIIGFFVVPVIGLPLGFILGVAIAEGVRLNDSATAWSAVLTTLKATGLSIAIEFGVSFIITLAWAIVSLVLALS